MSQRRVAITGLGLVSSIGIGCEEVLASLRDMHSGVRVVPRRRELGFFSALSGSVREFTPRWPLSRKQRKSMDEHVQWAHEAVREALEMAGLGEDVVGHPRTGLVFGNDSSSLASYRQADLMVRERSTRALHSGMVFQSMTSCVTMNLGAILGIKGASWTVASACSSGGQALGQAAELIWADRQDRMICGGVQEINEESICSFDALGAFSTREDAPSEAVRPFDRDRDGLVPSGGAAALVLENLDEARRRGATILGEVVSYAFSSDGVHLTVPSGDGLVRCMEDALRHAGLNREEIGYISAHGTGTIVGDAAEARAIGRVFGRHRPWVSSTKSLTGHELWMSGAAQVGYVLLAVRDGFIPGNRNYVGPDETTAVLRIAPEPVPERPRFVLCNAMGFGGTNSCLVIRPDYTGAG